MARDDYRTSKGEMENNHKKNQMIANAANQVGISKAELSEAVHAMKGDWDEGDFSYSELIQIAKDIKNGK